MRKYDEVFKNKRNEYNKSLRNTMNQIDDLNERYSCWLKNCINAEKGLSKEKFPLLYDCYWQSNYEINEVDAFIREAKRFNEKEKCRKLKLEAMEFNTLFVV